MDSFKSCGPALTPPVGLDRLDIQAADDRAEVRRQVEARINANVGAVHVALLDFKNTLALIMSGHAMRHCDRLAVAVETMKHERKRSKHESYDSLAQRKDPHV